MGGEEDRDVKITPEFLVSTVRGMITTVENSVNGC